MKNLFFRIIMALSVLTPLTIHAENLTLATVDWPPFYASNLPENGFYTAITKEAFKRAGYDVQIEFVSWNQQQKVQRPAYMMAY